MCHMKPSDVKSNNSYSGPESANWTLVDEGGEEVILFVLFQFLMNP